MGSFRYSDQFLVSHDAAVSVGLIAMRKILVNARFLVSPLTGVQRYAREMVIALHAGGKGQYDFVLAVPHEASFNISDDIQLFQDSSRLPGHLWEQMRLPAIMRRTNADLLWSPCGSGPLLVKKQVVTVHDASVLPAENASNGRIALSTERCFPCCPGASID